MMRVLKERYGAAEADARWQRIALQCDRWIREEGDLGGSSNAMSSNMYLMYAVCAFYDALDHNLTPEQFRAFATDAMGGMFRLLGLVNMNRLGGNRAVMRLAYRWLEGYKRKSDDKRGGQWGNTWKMSVNPKGRTEGLAFTLHTCPLYEFAQRHGYMDVLPNMCAMDQLVAQKMHAKLIRHNILSDGDPSCDYWYVGDESAAARADVGSK